MVVRMWGKGNAYTVLEGMKISSVAMQNSVVVPYAAILFLNTYLLEMIPAHPRDTHVDC
jgi:hypothetical protein